jgi:hypothetical protein
MVPSHDRKSQSLKIFRVRFPRKNIAAILLHWMAEKHRMVARNALEKNPEETWT